MQSGLIAYLDSVKSRDPAARSRWDVLFYPGVWALGLHRLAHWLWEGRLYFPARLINHFARFLTAIDIHPGAKIGERFFLDHGFSVIGETRRDRRRRHHLPARDPRRHQSDDGAGGKRHPTIRYGVVIGSGAQVLGPIEIGEGREDRRQFRRHQGCGAGLHCRRNPGRPVPVDAVHYSPGFMAYGTPCGEDVRPGSRASCRARKRDRRVAEGTGRCKAARQPRPKVKSA